MIRLTNVGPKARRLPYCSNCGQEVRAGAKFCPNCGTPLAAVQVSGGASAKVALRQASSKPIHATLMVALCVVAGVGFTAYGLLGLIIGYPTVGTVMIVVGILSFFVARGVSNARRWAWPLGTWAGLVYIIIGILALRSASIFSALCIVFGAWSAYYFNSRRVKQYLGRIEKRVSP